MHVSVKALHESELLIEESMSPLLSYWLRKACSVSCFKLAKRLAAAKSRTRFNKRSEVAVHSSCLSYQSRHLSSMSFTSPEQGISLSSSISSPSSSSVSSLSFE